MVMKLTTLFKLLAVSSVVASGAATPLHAAQQGAAKTVVLVHGAFADGTSWHKVIPLLKAAGLKVIAVQNPLDSLDNDVAFTNRALDIAEGPVVLVGHSWGGVVITQAGLHEKVKSLVYVASYAPDVGQSLVDVVKPYPEPAGQAFFTKDSKGYLKISDEGVYKHFAADLPRAEQEVVAATQGTFAAIAPATPVTKAAWHTVPSFIVISGNDSVAPPQMQRDNVKKLKAKGTEIPSSHVAMLSHPEAVAKVIIEASR